MPHTIHEIAYRLPNGQYQAIVEIPAGTLEKWQTYIKTGEFYHDEKEGQPRVINFLPYPFNYGFIPQTLLSKEKGGDGDPMDIVVLSTGQARGALCPVRVVGAIHLKERGETDTKIIGLQDGGPFADVQDISDLLIHYPGSVEILRLWFEGYKGPGSFLFGGYANRDESIALIELAHQDWKKIWLQ